MLLLCPKCSQPVNPEEINVAADLAKCLNCNEVFKASKLVEAPEAEDLANPPAGTTIVYDAAGGGLGAFRIPAKGLDAVTIFALIFALFWLSFVAFWTWGALRFSALFALFSIPFWLVGLGMFWGCIAAAWESQTIEIGREDIVLRKQSPLSRQTTRIGMAEIEAVGMESFMPNNPFKAMRQARRLAPRASGRTGVLVPVISHGNMKTRFGESLSAAEMEWLVKVLKATIYKFTGKRV